MQMTPEQLQELARAIAQASPVGPVGFNWLQGAMALGATLVSVTGVVVGMRAAISTLSKQLDNQIRRMDGLTVEVNHLAREVAVLKYAQGVESREMPEALG